MKIAAFIPSQWACNAGDEGSAQAQEIFLSALPSGTGTTGRSGKLVVSLPAGYAPIVCCSPGGARCLANVLRKTERGLGCTLLLAERREILDRATAEHYTANPTNASYQHEGGFSLETYLTTLKQLREPFNKEIPLLVILSRPSKARSSLHKGRWNCWTQWLSQMIGALGYEWRVVDLSDMPGSDAKKCFQDLHSEKAHILAICHNATDTDKGLVRLEVGHEGWISLEKLRELAMVESSLRLYWTCSSVKDGINPGIRSIRTTGTMILGKDGAPIVLAALLAFAWAYLSGLATNDTTYDRINAFFPGNNWATSQHYPISASCALARAGPDSIWYCIRDREFYDSRIPELFPPAGLEESELPDALGQILGNDWADDASALATTVPAEPMCLLLGVTHDGDLVLGTDTDWIEEGARQWHAAEAMRQWILLVEPTEGEDFDRTNFKVRCLVRPGRGSLPVSQFFRGFVEMTGKELAVLKWPNGTHVS